MDSKQSIIVAFYFKGLSLSTGFIEVNLGKFHADDIFDTISVFGVEGKHV